MYQNMANSAQRDIAKIIRPTRKLGSYHFQTLEKSQAMGIERFQSTFPNGRLMLRCMARASFRLWSRCFVYLP
jgi:hypothetical protein